MLPLAVLTLYTGINCTRFCHTVGNPSNEENICHKLRNANEAPVLSSKNHDFVEVSQSLDIFFLLITHDYFLRRV